MTDNQAVAEHYADYNGKRYYFCCDQCVSDFNSDPSRFAQLKSVQGFPIPNDDQSEATVQEACDSTMLSWVEQKINKYCLDYPLVQSRVFIVALILPFVWMSWRRTVSKLKRDADPDLGQNEKRPLLKRFFLFRPAMLPHLVWLLVLGLACDSAYLARLASKQERFVFESLYSATGDESDSGDIALLKTIDQVHYRSFFKYGFPPRPAAKTGANKLTGTYYRGNDERHEEMFNGGQYRTVSFSIQLETADGNGIDFGSSVEEDSKPYLRIQFVRANDTSNGYFTSEYMQRMYVTMKADRFLGRDTPVEDRIQWTEVESGRVWEARCPLPQGDQFPKDWRQGNETPADDDRFRGIVYLVEERYENDKVAAGRYHFGVEYDLIIQDNVVRPESYVHMGTIYEGRAFQKYSITADQWLSETPIPEKPSRDATFIASESKNSELR